MGLVRSASGCDCPSVRPLGASAEEIYGALAKMPKEKRQQVIVDRAQKEGKLVVYGCSE
jgi:hypothetical protein